MEELGIPRLLQLSPSVSLWPASFSYPVPRSFHRFGCLNWLQSLSILTLFYKALQSSTDSFCSQKNIPAPKSTPRQPRDSSSPCGLFLFISWPLLLLQGQQSHRFQGEKKKSSKTYWASHLVSLSATFFFSNALVIFMQGDWGERTDAAPVSSLLSSRSQWCSL